MRPGPPRGATATLDVTVTPNMSARVGGTEIHAVYGTQPLVAHVEQVCRQLLEPHLEPGEEGVGSRIELSHRAPVPIGEKVTLVATVASVTQHKLVCEVLVRHDGLIVARGSFEQSVVDQDEFTAEVDRRRTTTAPADAYQPTPAAVDGRRPAAAAADTGLHTVISS